MLLAKVQAATALSIRRLSATIAEAPINALLAIRMVANARHSITDVAPPIAVVS
jgi:hypothetical protein